MLGFVIVALFAVGLVAGDSASAPAQARRTQSSSRAQAAMGMPATHDSHTDYQLYHLARQHAPPPPPAYPGGSVAPGPIVVATPPPTTYPVQPAYPSQQPPVATYPPTEQPLAPGHCRVLGREGNCVTIPNFFACFRASGVLAPDIMRCPLAQACCLRNFF